MLHLMGTEASAFTSFVTTLLCFALYMVSVSSNSVIVILFSVRILRKMQCSYTCEKINELLAFSRYTHGLGSVFDNFRSFSDFWDKNSFSSAAAIQFEFRPRKQHHRRQSCVDNGIMLLWCTWTRKGEDGWDPSLTDTYVRAHRCAAQLAATGKSG